MTKSIPTIQKWMSTTPTTISRHATIAEAHHVLRDARIRHLPVVDGEALVGVISDRDLTLIESLRGVDARVARVEDAMTPHPYAVAPDARIDEVVVEMAEQRIGCAVVTQNGKVVGVFSAVDGLRAFAELLQTRLAA